MTETSPCFSQDSYLSGATGWHVGSLLKLTASIPKFNKLSRAGQENPCRCVRCNSDVAGVWCCCCWWPPPSHFYLSSFFPLPQDHSRAQPVRGVGSGQQPAGAGPALLQEGSHGGGDAAAVLPLRDQPAGRERQPAASRGIAAPGDHLRRGEWRRRARVQKSEGEAAT